MEAYTDLDQSKKLAEILPIESADMYYEEVCNLPKAIVGNYILHNQCMEDKDYKKLSNPVLSPAWSLAALLGVLPSYELNNFGDEIQLDVKREALATEGDETLIDLVVNMIIHLHELKML